MLRLALAGAHPSHSVYIHIHTPHHTPWMHTHECTYT
jgi:hypothetical protein